MYHKHNCVYAYLYKNLCLIVWVEQSFMQKKALLNIYLVQPKSIMSSNEDIYTIERVNKYITFKPLFLYGQIYAPL